MAARIALVAWLAPVAPSLAVPSSSEHVGLGLGLTAGGGTLAGAALDFEVGHHLFLGVGAGLRLGLNLDNGAKYPNGVLNLDVNTAFGKKDTRAGFFLSASATHPAAYAEAWASAGAAMRVKLRQGATETVLEIGPAYTFIRALPDDVSLAPGPFLFAKIFVFFPVVEFSGYHPAEASQEVAPDGAAEPAGDPEPDDPSEPVLEEK